MSASELPEAATVGAPSAESLAEALAVMRYFAEDLRRLADVDEPTRVELASLAGRLSRPDRYTRKALSKELARRRLHEKRREDDATLEQTAIRAMRRDPVFRTPLPMPSLPLEAPVRDDADEGGADAWAAAEAEREAPAMLGRVHKERMCYVCKAHFVEIHPFYDQMCQACAEFNLVKRNATADLQGRVVLVTGARVKIGYHAAIKCLRAGAEVIVLTRFPVDAAARYAREPDAEAWQHRLHVYGVDLRHTPSVEGVCRHVLANFTRLDGLINNACQTVRRPSGFYDHLLKLEHAPATQLPALEAAFLRHHHDALAHRQLPSGQAAEVAAGGIWHSAVLSQVPLLAEDLHRGSHLFPEGRLDADLQQVDLRTFNSWRMTLAEVPTAELLEVQLVNAIAPFVLNARLKPLMAKVTTRDTHIVNVSAMEGQFYRRWKTDKHPHTNMAKAALNMMTRTSAADYLRDGIHMTSVDTGWVTDEDPMHLAARKQVIHGFHPPLDIVDGAARIVDPLFDGVNTGKHFWGVFLKDYKVAPW